MPECRPWMEQLRNLSGRTVSTVCSGPTATTRLRQTCGLIGPRMSRAVLTGGLKNKQVRFADAVLAGGHTRVWLFENLAWSDLCNSALPQTEKVAASQALAMTRNVCGGKVGLGGVVLGSCCFCYGWGSPSPLHIPTRPPPTCH